MSHLTTHPLRLFLISLCIEIFPKRLTHDSMFACKLLNIDLAAHVNSRMVFFFWTFHPDIYSTVATSFLEMSR